MPTLIPPLLPFASHRWSLSLSHALSDGPAGPGSCSGRHPDNIPVNGRLHISKRIFRNALKFGLTPTEFTVKSTVGVLKKNYPWDPESTNFGVSVSASPGQRGEEGKHCLLQHPLHHSAHTVASERPSSLLPSVLGGHLLLCKHACVVPPLCARTHFMPTFCRNKLIRSKAVRSQRIDNFPVRSVRLFADGF